MAQFAIHLGIPPAQYYELTLGDQRALIAEWNRTQKQRRQ